MLKYGKLCRMLSLMSLLWNKCLEELRYQIPENVFSMWIRPLSVTEQGNTLLLHVPNQHFNDYIKINYLQQIQSLITQFEPTRQIDVKLYIESSVVEAIEKESYVIDNKNIPVDKNQPTQRIQQDFTFDHFVTGRTNQLAYGVCKETAKNLGKLKNNPLFLYGSTGVGKTHLMQAVANEIIKQNKKFLYFTSDRFVNQLVYALRQKTIDEFKEKIQQVDLLMIDDIHVIAGKPKTSLEFLLLLEEFLSYKKQVILASDKHPMTLLEFSESTRGRLSGGIVVVVEPPDLDVRVQILQKKAKLQGIDLPKDCAIFIAQHVVASVRELEGALNKLIITARLVSQPISLEVVQLALKDTIAIRVQAISLDNIRKVVAEFFDVSVKDLMGKKRTRQIARPRQIAMALARELTNQSYIEIGQSFGGRDHTTVMHACETIQNLCAKEVSMQQNYQTLKLMLQT